MKKIVLITGGFDPLHSGHIAYFKAAKTLGDWLVVGLNSDKWLVRKKGRPFMPLQERMAIVGNLAVVDEVVVYNDDDDEEKELGWAALQGMRVIAKVSNETRSLMWLPAIGKADDYITNFSTFTTAFNEAKVFFSLFTNLFWYVTAGVFDWEYAKEMGFYEKRTTRYEEGQPKALANLVKLSGVENILDIFNPEPSVKELYKKKQ
jgi:cytidyltransferase-like protein